MEMTITYDMPLLKGPRRGEAARSPVLDLRKLQGSLRRGRSQHRRSHVD